MFHYISGVTYECDSNATCGCASVPLTVVSRIVGGETAAVHSWPWMASFREYGSHMCGASILSSSYLITAAHCVFNITDLSIATILAGSSDLQPNESDEYYQILSIEQIYIHPDFQQSSFVNDVALIYLSSPLNMTNGNIKSICLPNDATPLPADNMSLVAIGWGSTSMWSSEVSPTLLQVTVQSIPTMSSKCQASIENSTVQFCAGTQNGGKDTCIGDSGGPLMEFVDGIWQLDGITTFGRGCALSIYPAVYGRVSYFVPWIQSILPTDQTLITTTMVSEKLTSTTSTTTTTTIINMTQPMSSTNSSEKTESTISATSSSVRNDTSTASTYNIVQSIVITNFLLMIIGIYS